MHNIISIKTSQQRTTANFAHCNPSPPNNVRDLILSFADLSDRIFDVLIILCLPRHRILYERPCKYLPPQYVSIGVQVVVGGNTSGATCETPDNGLTSNFDILWSAVVFQRALPSSYTVVYLKIIMVFPSPLRHSAPRRPQHLPLRLVGRVKKVRGV